MADTFIRTVVHVNKQFIPITSKSLCVNSITMVLTCDITLLCTNKTNRLIMTTMTILKFIYISTCSLCQQLVTHTDTTDWLRAYTHLLSYYVDSIRANIWITRTISKEKSIILHISIVIVPRNSHYLYTTFDKTSYNICLNTTINKNDFLSGTFIISDNILTRDSINKIHAFIISFWNIVWLIIKNDFTHHYTMFTQNFCKFPGVDTRYAWNMFTFKPVSKTFNSIPMTILLAIIINNNSRSINLITLHESWNAITFNCERRHTVISNKRISQRHKLSCIRRVC